MRLLLLNQYYAPDTAATAQLLTDVAEQLAAQGHEVHVIASRKSYATAESYPKTETRNGVQIHRVGASGLGRRSILRRLFDYFSYFALTAWKMIRLPRFDACLCLTTPPVLVKIPLSFSRAPVVLWSMDVYPEVAVALGVLKPDSFTNRLLGRITRKAYRRCAAVIALGENMKASLLQAGATEATLHVIPNWVPGEEIAPHPFPAGPLTILYSGNLGKGHEFDTLLKAARQLPAEKLRLVFQGSGVNRSVLEEQCRSEKIQAVFRDPVALDQLDASLAEAHMHFVSQRPETVGLIVPSKIYACLASGRPTLFVGSSTSDIAQLLDQHHAGWQIDPGDTDAMKALLNEVLDRPESLTSKGAKATACYRDHLGKERSVQAIIRLLEQTGG